MSLPSDVNRTLYVSVGEPAALTLLLDTVPCGSENTMWWLDRADHTCVSDAIRSGFHVHCIHRLNTC